MNHRPDEIVSRAANLIRKDAQLKTFCESSLLHSMIFTTNIKELV